MVLTRCSGPVWLRDRAPWALLTGGLLASAVITGVAAVLAPVWNPAPVLFLGFAMVDTSTYMPDRIPGYAPDITR